MMGSITILLILSYLILILDTIVIFNFCNTRTRLFWYILFFASVPKLILLNCDLAQANFVKRKWKSKNRNFAQIILLTKANWIWKCIFDTLLSSTCYLFEFNPGAHVVNKFFVSSKIRFFEGGSPGAYFIKLYGSINYGFIVTAKL